MIEYTYYRSGHWKAACACGWEFVSESVAHTHVNGRAHGKRCTA